MAPHFMAVPFFAPGGRSLVPARACSGGALTPTPRPAAWWGEQRGARGSGWTGRHHIGLDAREAAPLVENRPRDAGELLSQRNGEHIVVESLLRRFDPRFEPIAFPLLGPELDQHDPGGLNEQGA